MTANFSPRQQHNLRFQFLGKDAYPDVWTKAAALLRSVVCNHPLVDGNKRLGWVATAVFLELNDASVSAALDDEESQHTTGPKQEVPAVRRSSRIARRFQAWANYSGLDW